MWSWPVDDTRRLTRRHKHPRRFARFGKERPQHRRHKPCPRRQRTEHWNPPMSARRWSTLLFSPASLWHRRSILALFCVFQLATQQKGVCDPGVYPRLYGFSFVRSECDQPSASFHASPQRCRYNRSPIAPAAFSSLLMLAEHRHEHWTAPVRLADQACPRSCACRVAVHTQISSAPLAGSAAKSPRRATSASVYDQSSGSFRSSYQAFSCRSTHHPAHCRKWLPLSPHAVRMLLLLLFLRARCAFPPSLPVLALVSPGRAP